MSRTHAILGGLLLVQLVLIVLTRGPLGTTSGVTESRPLLPTLESFTPSKIRIADPEGEALNLVRRDDGWGLGGPDGYPVDSGKVEDLLNDLRSLEVRRPVVKSSRYHASLKVTEDDFERRLGIYADDSDEPRVGLILGTSPNYGLTHVRVKGDDRVYEVAGIAPYDARTSESSWIDTRFVNVPVEDVVGLKVTNRNGSFELRRAEEGWKVVSPGRMASREPVADEVEDLIRSAGSVWLAGPAGLLDEEVQGFVDPEAVVEFTVAEEPEAEAAPEEGETPAEGEAPDDEAPAPEPRTRTEIVRVGGPVEGEDGQRYISRSGFDFAGAVRESSVKKLLEAKLADLLG